MPSVVAGHSLGELAALAIAGVFSVEAGLELVVERSKLMATCALTTPGTMAAVLGLPSSDIAEPSRTSMGSGSRTTTPMPRWSSPVPTPASRRRPRGSRTPVPQRSYRSTCRPVPFPADGARPGRFRRALARSGLPRRPDPGRPEHQTCAATASEVIRERLIAQIASPVRWTETMAVIPGRGR